MTRRSPIRQESQEAWAKIRANLPRMRARLFEGLLNWGPMTDEQMIERLDLGPNSVRGRRGELVRDGLVVDTGRRGRTRAGNSATIWRARTAEEFRGWQAEQEALAAGQPVEVQGRLFP